MKKCNQTGSTARKCPNWINAALAIANLKLDTLTAARHEQARLSTADLRGSFSHPVFDLPPGFAENNWQEILDELPKHSVRFDSFALTSNNDVGYQYDNEYFKSPDTEVLYAIVQHYRPKRILELGCGNSTRIIRQAILDGSIACHHECLDPYPRLEISTLADEIIREPVEIQDPARLVGSLQSGDILFIDTSHELRPANDVTFIYGRLLMRIPPGTIVHIHDIFLPYEYPLEWILRGINWGEQNVVHSMLLGGNDWDVLWPGYFLQRTLPDFNSHFPHLTSGFAQSLWLRRKVN